MPSVAPGDSNKHKSLNTTPRIMDLGDGRKGQCLDSRLCTALQEVHLGHVRAPHPSRTVR